MPALKVMWRHLQGVVTREFNLARIRPAQNCEGPTGFQLESKFSLARILDSTVLNSLGTQLSKSHRNSIQINPTAS